ncbi:MAG: D-arabinono-1,4-lactone oxidase [Microbacteriaceae bacterium]
MDDATNWAGNYRYHATTLHRPSTVPQVQAIVSSAGSIRALGSRHSFNDIADSHAEQLSLENLPVGLEIDSARMTARFGGGARYGSVAELLHRRGFALQNLASLPHISVAGAIATATHGSGDHNQGLAASVTALDLVTASGDLITVERGTTPGFAGLVVGLGALGVVTAITVGIEKTYDVCQSVFDDMPWESLLEHFDEIMACGYSVSVFTNWRGAGPGQIWVKSRVATGTAAADAGASICTADATEAVQRGDLFGAARASVARHMIPGVSAENCTVQLGTAGPWFDRLPHFKLGFMPSNGQEIQSEYLVPRQHATAAIRALREVGDHLKSALLIGELRSVAADDLWLSTAYQQDVIGFHFTWRLDQQAVRAALSHVERALAPFDPRPHWGKVFLTGHDEIQRRYPRLDDFRRLTEQLDPAGTFRNDYLDRYIFDA